MPVPLLEASNKNLNAMVDLSVTALFVASQAAVWKMLEDPERGRKGGAIINISSQMGHVDAANRTAYCMTKHAVEGLTKATAVELAPNRIRVNSVGPPLVDTALARRSVDTPESARTSKAEFLWADWRASRT